MGRHEGISTNLAGRDKNPICRSPASSDRDSHQTECSHLEYRANLPAPPASASNASRGSAKAVPDCNTIHT
eukprot:scaffold18112_cov78-Skeletonema_dohrnii-CCMP3373.AAC.2